MSFKGIIYVTLGLLVWPGQSIPASSGSANGDAKLQEGQGHVQNTGGDAKIVYRGTEVTPETIEAQGGFIPNNRGKPQTDYTFGILSHTEGANSTMYTSTASTFQAANAFAYYYSGDPLMRYIYQIKTTPNMIDLGKNAYQGEEEYSALGGILFDQVMQWVELGPIDRNSSEYQDSPQVFESYEIFSEKRNKTWVKNSAYNAAKYDKLSASPPQPQLLEPNSKYGNKTLEQHAIEFMNKVGAVVGWDGKFPLAGVRPDGRSKNKTTTSENKNKTSSTSTRIGQGDKTKTKQEGPNGRFPVPPRDGKGCHGAECLHSTLEKGQEGKTETKTTLATITQGGEGQEDETITRPAPAKTKKKGQDPFPGQSQDGTGCHGAECLRPNKP